MKTLKQNNILIIGLFIVVVLMSVGFAIISTTLNINGTSKIKSQTWDIHFSNVKVTNGSVTATKEAFIANSTATLVEYEIVLERPEDYYEFTVDAVNEGSLDAKIESLALSGVEGHEGYLNYSTTYLNGEPLNVGDALNANTSETYKIRVEYKKDLASLPSEDQKINLTFAVTYSQGNDGEIVTSYYTLTGKVYDAEGQLMTSGEVEVHSKVITSPINPDGTYILRNVPVGSHEIIVKNESGEILKQDTFTLASGDITKVEDNNVQASSTNGVGINIFVEEDVILTTELPKHQVIIQSENGDSKTVSVTKGENYKFDILPHAGYKFYNMTCNTDENISYNETTGQIEVTKIDRNTSCNLVFVKTDDYYQGPVVTLSKNGNNIYQKSETVKINVSNKVGSLIEGSLTYIVSKDKNATPNINFKSGDEVEITGETGEYYLIVNACNELEICTNYVSEPYKIDNYSPTITINPNGLDTYTKSIDVNLSLADDTGLIDEGTLKYIITKEKDSTPNVSFTNGATLTLSGIDGEYYVIVKGCDQAGNCQTATSSVFKLDNESPIITFGTNGSNDYVKSILTTINVNDSKSDISTIKYVISENQNEVPNNLIDNGSEITLSGVTGEYYVVVEACDTAGNCATTSSAVFKLDNTGPTITFETNGNNSYEKTVATKVTITDNSNSLNADTIKYIISDDKEATPNKILLNGATISLSDVTGEYYVIVEACDNALNCERSVSNSFKLDNIAPNITITPNGTDNYEQTVDVTLDLVDLEDDIDQETLKYIITKDVSSQPTVPFTNGATLTLSNLNGNYYIVVKGCDKAGNCATKTSNQYKLDNGGPSITFSQNGNTTYAKSHSTKITAEDETANIATLKYIISADQEATPDTLITNAGEVTLSELTGRYYVIAEACDELGNCTKTSSKAFYLDNSAPTVIYGTNGNASYKQSHSTTIDVNANTGEINSIKYVVSTNKGDTPTTTITNGSTVTLKDLNGTYYVITEVCDIAGNCTTEVSQEFNLDNDAPIIRFTPNGNSAYQQSHSTIISVTDTYDEVETIEYIISKDKTATPNINLENNETVTIDNVTGTYYVVVKACDKAGNCQTTASNAFNVDNSAPTITYDPAGSSTYKKSHNVRISANANTGDIATIKYIVSDDTSATPNTDIANGGVVNIINKSGTYYVITEACDSAGNCRTLVSNPFNLDNEAPTISFVSNGNTTYQKSVDVVLIANDNVTKFSKVNYIISKDKNATPTNEVSNGGKVTVTGSTGEYYIIANVCDELDNCTTAVSNPYYIDSTGPIITFTPNGNAEYQKTHSTNVNVSDALSEVGTIEYIVSKDQGATPTTALTNGGAVSLSSGTGVYYVIVKACDNLGNCTTSTSSAFNMDNQAPTITYEPAGNSTYKKSHNVRISVNANTGDVATIKYVVSDTTSATPTTTIVNGGVVNIINKTGTYYVITEACDKAGNCTTTASPAFKLDNEEPSITFVTNGNSDYQKTASTTVIATDNVSSFSKVKYIVSKNQTATPTNEVSNGGTISLTGLTGTYYIIANVCDGLDNCKTEVSNPFYLDNGMPTILYSTNGNSDYQKSVNTKINVDANTGEIASIKYVTSTSKTAEPNTDIANGGTVTISGVTGTYYVITKACDKVGNCTTKVSNEFYLDNTVPSVTYSVDGTSDYQNSVSTTINASANTGDINTIKYIVSTDKTATPTTSLTNGGTVSISAKTGVYYIITEACDKAGNCKTVVSNPYYLDNSAPNISFEPNGNTTYQKTHNTKVTVNANTGTVNTIKYIVSTDKNATPTTTITNGGTITVSGGTGAHYVIVEACDKAGNCKTAVSNAFNLDNSAPTVTYGTNGSTTYAKTRTTTVSVNANTGEVNTIKYIVTKDQTAEPTTDITNGGTVTISGVTGTYYVITKACDKAGNCTKSVSNPFYMDNSAPTITIGTNGNSTYAKTASTTITASDPHVGLSTLKYAVSTSKTPAASEYVTLTSGGTVTISGKTGIYYISVEACDSLGNCNTTVSNPYYLDNGIPTITYGTNGNSSYAKSSSSTVTVNANTGEINSIKYVVSTNKGDTPTTTITNGGTVNLEGLTGTYYIVVEACDKAGNCKTQASNPFYMDNTAPTVTFSTNGNSTYQKSHSTKVTVNANTGELDTIQYIISSNSSATPNTTLTNGATLTLSNNTGTFYVIVKACDKTGNCKTTVSNPFNLDNQAPNISFNPNGNSTYQKSATVIVIGTDNVSKFDKVKYIVSTDKNATPTTELSNGGTVTISGKTGTYYVVVEACDTLGNCKTQASNPFYMDSSAPSITFEPNGSSWAKSASTKVTVNANTGEVNTIKYIVSTSATATPDTTLTNGGTVNMNSLTGTYYVVVEACDKAGNCTKQASSAFKLDNGVPTVTFGTNGNTTYAKSHSTTVSVNANTGEVNTIQYIVSTSATATPNTTIANGGTVTISGVTGTYYVVVKTCDKAGNCKTQASNPFYLDNTAPTITLGTNGNSTYAKTGSTKVTASDAHVTLNTLKYAISTNTSPASTEYTTMTSGGTVNITGKTGTYYVVIQACDSLGNCKTQASNPFYMDNGVPTITYGTNGNSAYVKSASSTVTVNANTGEVNTIKYIVSTSSTATPTTTIANGGTVSLTGLTGTHYIVVEACDKAGNCKKQASNAFKLDNTAPTITFGTNGNSTYVKSASTTITASDAHVTLKTLKYAISTSKTPASTEYTATTSGSTVTISGKTGTYYVVVEACDSLGNCKTGVSNPFYMDNSAPTITFGTNGSTTYAKSHSTTVSVNANTGEINTIKYIVSTSTTATPNTTISNGGTVNLTGLTGNHYVVVEACDKAGNCKKQASNAFYMDNSAPTITFEPNGNTTYAKSHTVKVTANANTGSLSSLQYIISSNSSATPNTTLTNGATLTLSNNTGTFYVIVKACDSAGNCTTQASNPFSLDNYAPTITFGTNGNSTYVKSASTTVTANANTGSLSSLQYIVSTSQTATPNTTLTNGGTVSLTGKTGTYYVVAKACDAAGNCTTKASNPFYLDNGIPIITFNPNGNTAYAKSRTTTVNVNANTGDINTIKYVVSNKSTDSASSGTTLTNGGTVTISGVTGLYYVIVEACDKAGNCKTQASNPFYMDNTAPTITLTPNTNTTWAKSYNIGVSISANTGEIDAIYVKEEYRALGNSEVPTPLSDTSNMTPVTSLTSYTMAPTNYAGYGYLLVKACDKAGNCTSIVSGRYDFDSQVPGITFHTNGNTTYQKSASTKISPNDLAPSSLKYIISTSQTATPNTTLSFGGTVNLEGLTGTYYVVATICDQAGNCTTKASNPFYMDNTAPTATATVSQNSAVVTIKDSKSLAGYQITTSSTTPTSYTAASGTSKTITYTAPGAGTYYVHVKDTAGNTYKTSFTITPSCAYEVGQVWTYEYTGDIQEFTTPCAGTYKLEVWGAAGSKYPGLGGYSVGNKTLTVDETLYVVVGGSGANGKYNGGGSGKYGPAGSSAGNGGGATHIATATGLLSELVENQSAVLIVAGGGGGGASYGSATCKGGGGGGESGIKGKLPSTNQGVAGPGGTQTAGGNGTNQAKDGSFGKGGAGAGGSGSGGGGGGGGGWYGGGGGSGYAGGVAAGGGGGSGYIGGVTDGETINGASEMPAAGSTTGLYTTGNSGNGYSRITLVSID